MQHTYQQAKIAVRKLRESFNYKSSDFYDDGEDIFSITYEDSERPAYDILIELKELKKDEEDRRRNTVHLHLDQEEGIY